MQPSFLALCALYRSAPPPRQLLPSLMPPLSPFVQVVTNVKSTSGYVLSFG
jgi:hypothetical protein